MHDGAVVVGTDVAVRRRTCVRLPSPSPSLPAPGVNLLTVDPQVAVAVVALLLVPQADHVTQLVQFLVVAAGFASAHDHLAAVEAPAERAVTRAAFIGGDEVQIVSLRGSRTKRDGRLRIPRVHRPQDRLLRRDVVVDHVWNDASRPQSRGVHRMHSPHLRKIRQAGSDAAGGVRSRFLGRSEDDVARVNRQAVDHLVGQLHAVEHGGLKTVALSPDTGSDQRRQHERGGTNAACIIFNHQGGELNTGRRTASGPTVCLPTAFCSRRQPDACCNLA